MTDFERLLKALSSNHVNFVIVGGVAATVHGSARLTTVDTADGSPENEPQRHRGHRDLCALCVSVVN